MLHLCDLCKYEHELFCKCNKTAYIVTKYNWIKHTVEIIGAFENEDRALIFMDNHPHNRWEDSLTCTEIEIQSGEK